MGPYDDCYESDEKIKKEAIRNANEKAKKLIRKAMEEAAPYNKAGFMMKCKEAIFWLEND